MDPAAWGTNRSTEYEKFLLRSFRLDYTLPTEDNILSPCYKLQLERVAFIELSGGGGSSQIFKQPPP